ncbi:sal-like protein 1 isoform X2 [Nilaparvata lugens]|uniref:sal-like protein 1 isoform X2 n=1 Tax=Nilaparvata lugens TaxID=108931 RepID=UPI00193DC477|nr:sal-like protein 1 isoform X2 [Nilaparvata lugens]
MTTKVQPAVPVASSSEVKQHANSTSSPISVPEGFLAKPPLDGDDGISSEEEEEEEEEPEEDEEEEEPVKAGPASSRRSSSASGSSNHSSASSKDKEPVKNASVEKVAVKNVSVEKVAVKNISMEKVAVKKEPMNDIEAEKVPPKKNEESNEMKKPIKKEPQVKVEKVSMVKVKKEPSAKDEDDKNESSGNDSGVESSGAESINSNKDVKNIPPPKIGSLTILGPSLLNSSVKNGSLSITPANALASPLNALSVMSAGSNPEAAAGGFVDAPLSNEYIPLDKLAMMGTTMRRNSTGGDGKCEVCGEVIGDATGLEAHRVTRKHFRCGDCAGLVVFDTRHDLDMHRASAHPMQPNAMASPQLYCGPSQVPPPPQPGSIQPRSFASLVAPPSQQTTELLNNVNTNQIQLMKRMQTQPPTDAPMAKGRRLDVSMDNGMGAASPVQLRPGSSVSISAATPKGGANVVANLLASRGGITVTPSGEAGRSQAPAPPSSPSRPPPPLTLGSAISIMPASSPSRQTSGFASPQGSARRGPPPTMALPTVDLTRDTPPRHQTHAPQMRRPPRARAFICQVCDKSFHTREGLSTHMSTHSSSSGKLSYRCNLCNAQYPTQQGLAQHKQSFHKESGGAGTEMALPVVDLRQPGVPDRLASLGIRHIIPLSQLQSSSGGLFGVPIIAIDNARSPAQANLGGLGASNILSLGPLKALPR